VSWAADETDDVGANELADALAWLGEHENLRDLRALVVQRESWVSAQNRAKGVLLHLVQMLKASNPPMSKTLSRCRSAMIPVLCSAQE
jgi:triphosphoribosyl-dephospho-CoA synthetase